MARPSQARKGQPRGTDRDEHWVTHPRVGIFHSTPQGRFTAVNPALVQLLGYASAAEVLALQLPDELYVEPAQRAWLRVTYEAGGVLDGVEVRWKTKAGAPLTVALYARAVRDARGRVSGYEGLVLDVTARTRAEAALRQSEERYRALFAACPDLLYVTDASGQLLDANPALMHWAGVPLEQLRHRPVWEVFAASNREALEQMVARLAQGHTVRGVQVEATTATGEHRTFEVNALPVPEQGTILSIARDITARTEAERALMLSQELRARITEALPDLVYVYDLRAQRTRWINHQSVPLLGYSPDTLQGQVGPLFGDLLHPDDGAVLAARVQDLADAAPQTPLETECRVRHASGEYRWLRLRETVLQRTPEGTPQEVLGTAQDITERKRLQRLLQEQPLDPRALGARLQQLRESLGMNQKAFGAYLGDYNQKQISSYETGEVMIPLDVLFTLRAKGHPLEVVMGTGSPAVFDETLRYLAAGHRERVVARQLAETLLHVLARDADTIERILGELAHPPKALSTSQRKLLESLAEFAKATR
jgi:PAS domain S-box-containing protein